MQKSIYLKNNLFISSLLFCFISISNFANAQDSAFKPSGKIWGHIFADYFYKNHTDSLGRGFGQYANGGKAPTTGNYPQSLNEFQYRRFYLGYTYEIAPKFTADILLSSEEDVAGKDVLANNKFAPYIKYANIRWKGIYPGADLVIGQMSTSAYTLTSEVLWGYRSVDKTIADFHGTPSFDLGAGIQGKFDPKTENYGYNVMVGNGTKALPASNSFKWFYSDVWAKLLNKKLIVDLYADYNMLLRQPSTATIPTFNQSRNMIKLVVGYGTPTFSVGAEGFINTIQNQISAIETATSKKDTLSPIAMGISLFAHGTIVKDKLVVFVRYDALNPNNKIDNNKYGASYAYIGNGKITNGYGDAWFSKEQFFTTGLDYIPNKNVHIIPNIWYNGYTAQFSPTAIGTKAKDFDLVYRITVAYAFGK